MKSIHLAALAVVCLASACGVGNDPAAAAQSTGSTPQTGTTAQDLNGGGGWGSRHRTAFSRTDLVSDLAGAKHQDPNLVNAWGLAFGPTGKAWISSNEEGLALIYDANGNSAGAPIMVPPPPGSTDTAAPTGQVFNGNPAAFMGDVFIIATEDGTLSGWQPSAGGAFVLRIDSSTAGAVFKGVALSSFEGQPRLFAADFHNGAVDAFDAAYAPLTTSGGFKDDEIPCGFAPFNVYAWNGALLVLYAKQDDAAHDDVAGPGNGFVDLFDTDGNLVRRLIRHDGLNSPWGVAVTPADFGRLSNRLLIGNFGDGRVNVFRIGDDDDDMRLEHDGTLLDALGGPMTIDGLWALSFGNGAGGFDSHVLYFTAGPQGESHGVFGQLEKVDAPHRRW
jgi:uncharacterized protein (TIGR03118 family)